MKKIKGYAIMPALKDNKELQHFPYLSTNKQLMIFIDKKSAVKANETMDEFIEECIITFK